MSSWSAVIWNTSLPFKAVYQFHLWAQQHTISWSRFDNLGVCESNAGTRYHVSLPRVQQEATNIRHPNTQIHSGTHLISPHCEVKGAERRRSYTDTPTRLKTSWLVCRCNVHLQGVGPVAGGPAGDAQSGDGVASVDLWRRCKPALPRACAAWWGRLALRWSKLSTHIHTHTHPMSTDGPYTDVLWSTLGVFTCSCNSPEQLLEL